MTESRPCAPAVSVLGHHTCSASTRNPLWVQRILGVGHPSPGGMASPKKQNGKSNVGPSPCLYLPVPALPGGGRHKLRAPLASFPFLQRPGSSSDMGGFNLS
ncbi:hypothetical protein FALCPG4_001148 [Fusarium falciforme]